MPGEDQGKSLKDVSTDALNMAPSSFTRNSILHVEERRCRSTHHYDLCLCYFSDILFTKVSNEVQML